MTRVARLACALLAASAAASGAVQTVTIGELYAGGTVSLAPADTLEVKLSPGPSGCAWGVAFSDPAVLAPDTGAATSPVFRFKAITTGSVSLGLACRKALELSEVLGRIALSGRNMTFTSRHLPQGLLLSPSCFKWVRPILPIMQGKIR